jgi:hypothetical protein
MFGGTFFLVLLKLKSSSVSVPTQSGFLPQLYEVQSSRKAAEIFTFYTLPSSQKDDCLTEIHVADIHYSYVLFISSEEFKKRCNTKNDFALNDLIISYYYY